MTEARPDLKLTIDCIVAKDVEEKRKEKKLDKCHKSSSSLDATCDQHRLERIDAVLLLV